MTPERAAQRYLRYAKPAQRRRRTAGLCISCEHPVTEINPRTGRPFWRCETHRAMASAASTRYSTPLWAQRRSEGLCRECGCEADRNPETGQRYVRCRRCRVRESGYSQKSRERQSRAQRREAIVAWQEARRERREDGWTL